MEKIEKYLTKKGINFDKAKRTGLDEYMLFVKISDVKDHENKSSILKYIDKNTVWGYCGNYEYYKIIDIKG